MSKLIFVRAFIAAVAAIGVALFMASTAAAGPLILATAEVPGCSGNTSNVSVTLNSETYSFFGGTLWFHFTNGSGNSTVIQETAGNPVVLPLAPGTYSLTITTAQGTGGSGSPQYSGITVTSCGGGQTGGIAPNTYTCQEQVTTGQVPQAGVTSAQIASGKWTPVSGHSGINTLGTTMVPATSVPAIRYAASECHNATRLAFKANTAWSDPAQVCIRNNGFNHYTQPTTYVVEAIDSFKEIAPPPYNRVDGFAVTCNGAQVTNIVQLGQQLLVVPSL